MALTIEVQDQIRTMRRAGVAYSKIGEFLAVNPNTVKSWCRRSGIEPESHTGPGLEPLGTWCRLCGDELAQAARAKFCSDTCRRSWWSTHPELIERRAFYHFACQRCGTEFEAYGNTERKYCSHSCYIQHRFGTRGGRA